MPNPKRRHSNSRTRMRRAHDALKFAPVQRCPRCGSATRSHHVCDNCGHYGFAKGGQKGTDVLGREEV
jgi:large subunit ribosomal protein L32